MGIILVQNEAQGVKGMDLVPQLIIGVFGPSNWIKVIVFAHQL